LHMAPVENIKTAIGKDEFSSGRIESITQLSRLGRRKNSRAHTVVICI
jgi:hypothetical protein